MCVCVCVVNGPFLSGKGKGCQQAIVNNVVHSRKYWSKVDKCSFTLMSIRAGAHTLYSPTAGLCMWVWV